MSFLLKEDTEVEVMLWVEVLVPGEGKPFNLLGGVYRQKGDELWTMKYRFRYYFDDKAFHSQDERTWYAYESADVLHLARGLAGVFLLTAERFGVVPDVICENCNGTKATDEMMERFDHATHVFGDDAGSRDVPNAPGGDA